MWKKSIKSALLAVLLCSGPANAEDSSLPPSIKAFAQSYGAALHANNAARLEALTDPKAVACILKTSPIWFDQEAFTYAHSDISAEPTMVLRDFTFSIPEGIVFPNKPEKLLTIKWKYGTDLEGGEVTAQLGIIETKAGVVRTLPCPTADAIKTRNMFFEGKGFKSPSPPTP